MRVADLIVKALEAQSISRVYCVPGESYLALLDALYESPIKTIVCRHESGAGFMAVAEAKMTGRPAVFMVSRGPGATNGSIAVHVAQQDAVPVIVLIGQVSREERGRGAFQEVDYTHFFGEMAKGVFELHDASKVAETMVRAFHLAAQGVPGPVVIALPEDLLEDESEHKLPAPFPIARPKHSPQQMEALQKLIDGSERPLLMAGGEFRGKAGAQALARFAEAQRVPVAVTWKNQDVFDNSSPLFAGHIGVGSPAALRELLSKSDLVIAAGTRLGDIATLNYNFPRAPEPVQPLVHIYSDGGPIGHLFHTELGIVADPVGIIEELGRTTRVVSSGREQWITSIASFISGFSIFQSQQPADGVDFGEVVTAIAEQAPKDSIITTDAGNISTWVHRHWRMTPNNLLLGAIAGAMGFGVPAGVAAGFEAPERMCFVFVGDGGILMTGQELATAIQYSGKLRIVLSDNGTYGTIRTHQERHYPERVSGTDLVNPDFSQWGRAFGAHVVTIALGDDVGAKVVEAIAHDGPVLIHVKSSAEALSAYSTISKLRGK